MRDSILLTIAVAALLPGAGCEPTRMALPEHFVEIDDADRSGFPKRGVSADGVVVAFDLRENLRNGTLAFWTRAMRNDLTGRGYHFVKAEQVTGTSGRTGELMTFSARQQGRDFTYLLAVFIDGRRVRIAEAGGKAEAVQQRLADVRRSLLSAG